MQVIELKEPNYAWIDYVTIDNVDKIVIEDEMVSFFKDGKEIANAILGYVNEVGYRYYKDNDELNTKDTHIVYEY